MKNILLLGATGSVGTSVLDILEKYPEKFKLVGVATANISEGLIKICQKFKPKFAAVKNIKNENEKNNLEEYVKNIFTGEYAAKNLIKEAEAKICVAAMPGSCGIEPAFTAVEKGMDIVLANKEVLVAAGDLFKKKIKEKNVKLMPLDSEHAAIHQCLNNKPIEYIKKLIITGSGGPFRKKNIKELENVTPKDALNHPTWKMGNKISIDSATLANKALEFIEAKHLFEIEDDKIEIVIHPESIIHGMVEFIDGSIIANMSKPDMRFPVQYAMLYPDLPKYELPRLNLTKIGQLNFEEPDYQKFPLLKMGIMAGKIGGYYPAAFNTANEIVGNYFLEGKIKFKDMEKIVDKAISKTSPGKPKNLGDIINENKKIADFVNDIVRSK